MVHPPCTVPDPTDTPRDDAAPAGEPAGSAAPEVDEDDLDLALMEREGIDGVVSRLRASADDEDEPLTLPRRRRSPLVSLAVVAFGIYLLVNMWGDFRYWLRPSEPEDLGDVANLVEHERLPPGLANHYVRLSGTPDVQHAARLTTERNFVGYRRIVEAGGSLFVAIPRDKSEKVADVFLGTFEGRMEPMRDHPTFPWLKQFFDGEDLVRIVDSSGQDLVEMLRSGSWTLRTEDGPMDLVGADRIRLVSQLPEATVQLGKSSFPRATEADARVAALGKPWTRVERSASSGFHTYLVRLTPQEQEDAQLALERGVAITNRADPRQGVLVVPRTATYLASPKDLRLEQGPGGPEIVFPYGDNVATPGYDVKDSKLVERTLTDGTMRVPVARLKAVRVERPIRVDPSGYVLIHGEKPSDERTQGILWLVVLGLTLVNAASLVLWWRRRRS